MTHLDDIRLVDALDDAHALDDASAAHLAACASCASRVEELRATMRAVAADDVPEPSALFWRHFGERVGAALERAPARGSRWFGMPQFAWAGVAAIAIVISLVFAASRPLAPAPPASPVASVAGTGEPASGADDAWALVESLAEDVDYDDVSEAGILPRPGAVERATLDLTDDERAELARLIEAELKRTGP